MPRVTFVNEHVTVEVDAGRTILAIAGDLGIAIRRATFAGTRVGDCTVWVEAEPGGLSPPTLRERWRGVRGWKRYADQARVLGDVAVYTQPGLDRGSARALDAPPSPATDPTARRLPVDASGSAAFPFGNPKAVGRGERAAIPRSAAKAKPAKADARAAEDEAEG